ncbi:MAG: CoA-transferase, partial [Thermomicrobium sp.]
MDRLLATYDEAVADIPNGASIMMGGFGPPGIPVNLVQALRRRRLRDLVLIYCGGGTEQDGIGGLIADGAVRKLINTYPIHPGAIPCVSPASRSTCTDTSGSIDAVCRHM